MLGDDLDRRRKLRASRSPAGAEEKLVVIETAVDIVRHGVESRLVVESSDDVRRDGNVDNSLIRAIACGRAWFEELANGKAASFGEIAARVGVTDRYVSRIVDLALLAPNAVYAILAGEQRPELTVTSMTVHGSLPSLWTERPSSVWRNC